MEPTEHHRAPVHHAARREKMNMNKIIIAVVAAVVIVIIGAVAAFLLKPSDNTGTAIDSSKYQAVFFTNGQVYFGKLQAFNSSYFKLKDIYYLQASQASTDTKNPQKTDDSSNVTLIKLGSEIHGPDDEMVLNKDQVLFFENLKADGKVTKSISQYQNPNK